MIFFQICHAIAIYKWRWLADWIFVQYVIFRLLDSCIPSNKVAMTDLAILEWHLQAFALFYTDLGGQIIFNCATQLIAAFVLMPMIYM